MYLANSSLSFTHFILQIMTKVIVLGGGVAGMSAAHELIERGFEVEVYEKKSVYVGGKARSIDYFGDNMGQKYTNPLPGEHGFRFFPGFYKHVTDTMKRTPVGNGKTAFDNLVQATRVMMARQGKPPVTSIVTFPKSIEDLEVLINSLFNSDFGFTDNDKKLIVKTLWQLMTSSYDRRKDEYERISWWEFSRADEGSQAYRDYFAAGLLRTLVASKADLASTKTAGDILLQLLFLVASPSKQADRVLNQPTNEAWLTPWYNYLISKGVKYYKNHETVGLTCSNGKIGSAQVKDDKGNVKNIVGDYYISCVPVEVMANLLNQDMTHIDPTLKSLVPLAKATNWMTGIQFFLNQDVKLAEGHEIYADSPWALTSISQIQFWKDYDITKRGNGQVRGVLSVDISDWYKAYPPNFPAASECKTKEEVKNGVWQQLKDSLIDKNGNPLLTDDMLVDWYLDRDIEFSDTPPYTKNEEPLLVNQINTWELRPDAFTRIPNFFLASDYVRTYTDLATMEGANEAARRAVNGIIQASGSKANLCKLWNLHEPEILRVYRWYDSLQKNKGLPWNTGRKLPFPYNIINWVNLSWIALKKLLGLL